MNFKSTRSDREAESGTGTELWLSVLGVLVLTRADSLTLVQSTFFYCWIGLADQSKNLRLKEHRYES